jgi:predicted transposase/invertase (TIGR01784 family)
MSANIKYKDSVFSSLFSDPDILRELYCALKDVSLPPDVPITINTLKNVLFMDRINDISFEIGDKLVVLIEHQSTINPNIALRFLMYISRVYEKILEPKKLYSTKRRLIPRPEFFVLYNGAAEYPDETILKLSDSYEDIASLGLSEDDIPRLELIVKVVNINHGRNEEKVKKCITLADYSAFVGKVHEYEKEGLGREEAIKKAIKYCLERDILKKFLEENSTEVLNMLLTEWNWDDAKQVWHEEGREEGREEVIRNALAKGHSIELIHEITGLDIETIEKFAKKDSI